MATSKTSSAEDVTASSGKLYPPSSDVDVPNMPAAHPHAKDAQDCGKSPTMTSPPDPTSVCDVDIDPTKSSWADSTQPAPDKKNARSSIL